MRPLVTSYDMDAIWLEGEPDASEAFNRIASDHGERFARLFRDLILASKMIAGLTQDEALIEAIEGDDQ